MEHAREAIPGARPCPLSQLSPETLGARTEKAPAVIFHCQGGNRTRDNDQRLQACSQSQAYILEGGLAGWKAAGFATRIDRSRPIEIQRQVQIAAGSLILFGLLLAWLVAPSFILLTGFIGVGLIFAGASGWCGMARLLALLPWNRHPA